MLSKLGLLLVAISMVGCAGEDQPAVWPVEVKAEGAACFTEGSSIIDKFLTAQLNEGELREFWSCTRNSITLFKKYARGEAPDVYSAEELRSFFQTYFFQESRLTSSFMTELMRIKELLVGGEIQQVRLSELTELSEFTEELEEVSVEMLPHLHILVNSSGGSKLQAVNDFEHSLEKLQSIAKRLGSLLESHGRRYRFANLKRFLVELEFLARPDSQSLWAQKAAVFARIKSLYVGPSLDAIETDEWERLFVSMTELFGVWSRLTRFVTPSDWYQGEGLQQLNVSVESIYKMTADAIATRPQRRFLHSEITSLFDEFAAATSGNKSMAPVLGKTWIVMVDKWLGELGTNEASGLTVDKLRRLKSEYDRWSKIQSKLMSKCSSDGICKIELPQNDEVFAEMRRVLSGSPWPLVLDEKRRLVIGSTRHNYTAEALTELNWQRALVRVLIRAYAQQGQRRQKLIGLTVPELEEVFVDLKDFAVELGLIDPGNDSFYRRVYREGGLFLPRSNGDAVMDLEEGIEYAIYAFAGIRASEELTNSLNDLCARNLNGAYAVGCFRSVVESDYNQWFSHLAGMVGYVESLKQQDKFAPWMRALEGTVRSDSGEDFISKSDIAEFFILHQYIETFLQRFDRDESDTINLTEALESLTVFRLIIADLFNLDPEENRSEIRNLYTYMMKYGGPPSPLDDPLSDIRYNHWKWHPHKWRFEADRLVLARILRGLAAL